MGEHGARAASEHRAKSQLLPPRSWALGLAAAGTSLVVGLGAGPAPAVVSPPGAAPAVLAPPAAVEAAWQWPLHPAPRVLRVFRPPAQRWLAGHRGIDLAATPGQSVHAAAGGTVTFAGYIVDRGVVVVGHGALSTTYEPIDPSVRRGDAVGRGSLLGAVGAASSHCPGQSCLHWGLRRGREYLDPMLVIDPGPVRLLPVWVPGRLAG